MAHSFSLSFLLALVALVCMASASVGTVAEYKDLIGGTTFEGTCRTSAAKDSGNAMVCLPGANTIPFSFRTISSLNGSDLLEDYLFMEATATIGGANYTWEQIHVQNSLITVQEVNVTSSGLILARLSDSDGFCWWVRINVNDRTYQEYGNYRLDSPSNVPDSCPPQPADNVANPTVMCDGTTFTYLCNGVLTAGEWPGSASSLHSFLAPVLKYFFFF